MSESLPSDLAALCEQAHREQNLEKLLELVQKMKEYMAQQLREFEADKRARDR